MLLATTLVATMPRVAAADPVSGPYVSLGAGVDFLQNERFKLPPQFSKRSYTFDAGPAVAASVGYGLGNGIRVEVEGDYANNHVKGFKVAVPARGGGHEQQYGGFANALYDLDLKLPVTPYVGVGVGYQEVELDGVNGGAVGQLVSSRAAGSAGNFAYQGIAGVGYAVSAVPGLSLTAEYRIIGVQAPSEVHYAGPFRVHASVENIFNHELLFGLRYAFEAPKIRNDKPELIGCYCGHAPNVRTWLVFFDWDRADLTARAREIVAGAAGSAGSAKTTRIEVYGHADPSGTEAYNQALSVRRAQAVAAELIRDGVPKSEIDVQGFGNLRPLVPAAAGVREPQNRRVEIVLRQ